MTNQYQIPERDEEILKVLYGTKFDNQKTYAIILEK